MKVKLDNGAYAPNKAHETDAGYDLRSPRETHLAPRRQEVIDTGVHIEIPQGYYGQISSKSGLCVNHGVIAEAGVIDSGYTGSIRVCLRNNGLEPYVIEAGDKIAQLIIIPIYHDKIDVVNELDKTERGDDGFGSSGR